MRPVVEFLGRELVERIVAEARDVLRMLGVEINNPGILSLLADHGADVDAAAKRDTIWFEPSDTVSAEPLERFTRMPGS